MFSQMRNRVREMLAAGESSPEPESSSPPLGVVPEGKTSPPPMTVLDAISVGEVRRRVDQAVERAIAKLDGEFLAGVVVFAETSKTIAGPSAKFIFDDPNRLRTLVSWLRANYMDLVREFTLQVQCAPATSALAVITASRAYADALGILPEQLMETLRAGERESPRTPTAILTVHGRGICSVLSGLATHLRQLADVYASEQPRLRGASKAVILAGFLESLLHDCPAPARNAQVAWPVAAPAPATSVTGGAAAAGPAPVPSDPALDPALFPALTRRLHALMATLADGSAQPDSQGLQEELKRFAKKGDALGVAAAACLLWQVREPLPERVHVAEREVRVEPGRANREPPAVERDPAANVPVMVTTAEFAKLIRYDVRTVRERLIRDVLKEGEHFTRRKGGRKILIYRDKALALFHQGGLL